MSTKFYKKKKETIAVKTYSSVVLGYKMAVDFSPIKKHSREYNYFN